MAQEAQNHARGKTTLITCFTQGACDTGKHGGDRNAACSMGLRVEKDFGVQHIVGNGPINIRAGQIIKILFSLQDSSTGVIQIQKRLQIGELVGGADCFHAVVWQRDLIAACQCKHHFRFQRTFDMQMQFSFG